MELDGDCVTHFVDPDYKVPEDGWFEYKSFEMYYGNVKTINNYSKTGLTMEDLKKQAVELGCNSIAIRHDRDKIYFKKFDNLKTKDMQKSGDYCDFWIYDPSFK